METFYACAKLVEAIFTILAIFAGGLIFVLILLACIYRWFTEENK